MVFQDIAPVPEIDNELLLFRELVNIKSKYRSSLLISQGGRITQHLVEVLARNKGYIGYDIYNSDFKDFLDECDFIPMPVREFILIINDYRKNVVYSLDFEEELGEVMLSFFKTFNDILNWFQNYYHYEFYYEVRGFKEITKTMNFLNREIIKLEGRKLNDDNFEEINEFNEFESIYTEHFPNEADMIHEIYLAMPEFRNAMNIILQRSGLSIEYHENHSNQINNLRNSVNDIDDKLDDVGDSLTDLGSKMDQVLLELKNLDADFDDYRKQIETKLENVRSDEERDKILSEFTDKCVKKIRNSIEDKIVGTDVYKKEENDLIESLGKSAWEKLSRQSKTFLITARITFNSLNNLKDIIDYSGVCLLVTKAVEVELCKRFYKGFSNYLWDNYQKDYSKYHTSLIKWVPEKNNYRRLKKPRDCDLGRITYILGFNRNGIGNEEYKNNMLRIIEYSKINYLKDLTDDEIEEKLVYYGSLVDNIRVNYRNPAAHTRELKCPDAKECFNFVLYSERVLKIMLDSFEK